MTHQRLVIAAVAATALLLLATPARAHDPLFLTSEQTTPETGPFLPDGTISFALYGQIDAPGDTRGLQVEFAAGDGLLMELLIPDRTPENGYDDGDLPVATVTAPDGSVFALEPDMRQPFDEPFSGTSYVSLSRIETEAQAGLYDIVVTGAAPARFTFSVGTIESFLTPVERVDNRASSLAGITEPLRAWYDTPPQAAVATSDSAAATTATTTPPTTSTTTTPTGAVDTTDTVTPAAAPATEDSGGDSAGIVVIALAAGVATAAAFVFLRRRSRHAAD